MLFLNFYSDYREDQIRKLTPGEMDEIREILSRNLYQIRQRVRIIYLAKYLLLLTKNIPSDFVLPNYRGY